MTDHNRFYWVLDVTENEYIIVCKKCAKGEYVIREFYRNLMRIIEKANKLSAKFKKGTVWIKKFLISKLKKINGEKESDLSEKVAAMSDDEIKDFLIIHDKEEISKLISGDMITAEVMGEKSET